LEQTAADVYCLQEVLSEQVVTLLQEKLGSKYSFHRGHLDGYRMIARTALDLSASLFGLVLMYAAHDVCRLPLPGSGERIMQYLSAISVGIASSYMWRVARQTVLWSFAFSGPASGLLILCRKESVQVRSHWHQPFIEQGGDFMNLIRPRGYLRAKLRICDIPVSVTTMHANAFPTVNVRNAVPIPCGKRSHQLRQGFAASVSQAEDGEALIVTGDLNTQPNFNEIPASEYGFSDACKHLGTYVTVPRTEVLLSVFPETHEDMCLDYQFVKALVVEAAQLVHFGQVSDHLPVKVTYFPEKS